MTTLHLPPSPALDDPRAGSRVTANAHASSLAAAATVASDLLLRGRKVIQIEHNGALYQLRATKLGKLILTK